MPLRVIGYDGAAYRAELETPDRYPVVTLVLYFGDKPWGKKKTIFDIVKIPEKIRPYVNDYKMHVFDIAFLSDEQLDMFQSDFKIVAKYFVDRRKSGNPGFPKDIPKHVDEVLKLLSAMTGDERFVLGWQNHLREESGNRKEGGTMAEKWIDEIEKRGMIKAYSDIGLSIEQIAKKVEVTVDYVKQVLNPDSLSANL
jgi:hypothetical protein